jgi:hypothetical protein
MPQEADAFVPIFPSRPAGHGRCRKKIAWNSAPSTPVNLTACSRTLRALGQTRTCNGRSNTMAKATELIG